MCYLSRKKHNFLISLINYRAILILLMINWERFSSYLIPSLLNCMLKCPSRQIFSIYFKKEYILWWRLKNELSKSIESSRNYEGLKLWCSGSWPIVPLLRRLCDQLVFISSFWPCTAWTLGKTTIPILSFLSLSMHIWKACLALAPKRTGRRSRLA